MANPNESNSTNDNEQKETPVLEGQQPAKEGEVSPLEAEKNEDKKEVEEAILSEEEKKKKEEEKKAEAKRRAKESQAAKAKKEKENDYSPKTTEELVEDFIALALGGGRNPVLDAVEFFFDLLGAAIYKTFVPGLLKNAQEHMNQELEVKPPEPKEEPVFNDLWKENLAKAADDAVTNVEQIGRDFPELKENSEKLKEQLQGFKRSLYDPTNVREQENTADPEAQSEAQPVAQTTSEPQAQTNPAAPDAHRNGPLESPVTAETKLKRVDARTPQNQELVQVTEEKMKLARALASGHIAFLKETAGNEPDEHLSKYETPEEQEKLARDLLKTGFVDFLTYGMTDEQKANLMQMNGRDVTAHMDSILRNIGVYSNDTQDKDIKEIMIAAKVASDVNKKPVSELNKNEVDAIRNNPAFKELTNYDDEKTKSELLATSDSCQLGGNFKLLDEFMKQQQPSAPTQSATPVQGEPQTS